MRIAVYGAGAWGTALALSYAPKHAVTLWVRDAAQAAAIQGQRENRLYLPGFALPDNLRIEADMRVAALGTDVSVVATPLAGLRETLSALRDSAPAVPVVWACKGLEAGSGKLPHQIVADTLGAGIKAAALSGPSFAEEVARGLPTAVTLASADLGFATAMVQALNSARLRLYSNDDVIGVEVAGAVKNVLAIAAGIADGMGFGLNARAAMITRGIAEMARLGSALGGKRETFMGLAGMGDLILTCTGDLSRNRQVGLALAGGRALHRILRELGHTAEGVSSAREVAKLAEDLDVEMPITQAVMRVLFDRVDPKAAVEQLLSRDPKVES